MESFGSIHSEPSLLDSEKGSAHSVATHGSRRLTAQSVVVLMAALPAVPPASLKSTCLCCTVLGTELYPGAAQDYSN